MYAPPPAVAAGAGRRSGLAASGPLLAVCCLLFILFLIASTIILALIPVYLATKDSNSSTRSSTYLMTGTPQNSDLIDGTLTQDSLNTINAAAAKATNTPTDSFGSSTGAASTASTGKRRRRGFGLVRQRRAKAILRCKFWFNRLKCGGRCDNGAFRKSIQTFIITVTITIVSTSGISTTFQNVVFVITLTYSTSFPFPDPVSSSSSSGKVLG